MAYSRKSRYEAIRNHFKNLLDSCLEFSASQDIGEYSTRISIFDIEPGIMLREPLSCRLSFKIGSADRSNIVTIVFSKSFFDWLYLFDDEAGSNINSDYFTGNRMITVFARHRYGAGRPEQCRFRNIWFSKKPFRLTMNLYVGGDSRGHSARIRFDQESINLISGFLHMNYPRFL